MRHAGLGGATALGLLLLLPPGVARAQGAPLDVTDPTPRGVLVQVENSSNFASVGQSFGPPFLASYSVSGSTGSVTISAATHAEMRSSSFLEPVPGSFSPLVIRVDLTSLEATSQPASGALVSGPISLAFTQRVLDTTATGGFLGPNVGPLFCTSQQQVDDACQIVPIFCGLTCTLVPGSAYDTATGRVNLIGIETQSGCDGSLCDGPYDYFTPHGDLRLTEAPGIPALPGLAALALCAALALSARRVRAG